MFVLENIYEGHVSEHQRENMSTGSIHQHFDLAPNDIEQKSSHNSKSEQIIFFTISGST